MSESYKARFHDGDDWSWLEQFPEEEQDFAEFAVRYIRDQDPRPVPEAELNKAWKLYYAKTLVPIYTDQLWRKGFLNVKLVGRGKEQDLGWKTTKHGAEEIRKNAR